MNTNIMGKHTSSILPIWCHNLKVACHKVRGVCVFNIESPSAIKLLTDFWLLDKDPFVMKVWVVVQIFILPFLPPSVLSSFLSRWAEACTISQILV